MHHQLRGHQSHAQVAAAVEISTALVVLEVQVVAVTALHQVMEVQELQILVVAEEGVVSVEVLGVRLVQV